MYLPYGGGEYPLPVREPEGGDERGDGHDDDAGDAVEELRHVAADQEGQVGGGGDGAEDGGGGHQEAAQQDRLPDEELRDEMTFIVFIAFKLLTFW